MSGLINGIGRYHGFDLVEHGRCAGDGNHPPPTARMKSVVAVNIVCRWQLGKEGSSAEV